MADRRVKVVFSAEVQNFKAAVAEAAASTEKLKKASEQAGKKSDEANAKIAEGHQKAAKAVGLQYSAMGQLVDMNGKALSSQQAAAHGLESFSKEAYLAGRAATEAGEASEVAAKAAAVAQQKHAEAMEEVGRVAAIAGAAVLAGVGLAVKAYADFDKQMSAVDAATHETASNMDLLRQAAIDAGADTAFSAGEAAQGIEQMAKAGVSTKDILGGGLTGALSLAAAGSLDVGKAAEIASSAMTQFKLSGDKLPHVADLLAAGAGKAQGSVEDLGAALNQSGLVASQMGLTIEETTGGLAAFASAGLIGSDAGTSFKSMLQRLNPQSEEAAKLMKELGLSAYDSQGNFIGLSEYAGELQTALGGMTTEQRNATLSTLFGSDAIRAASVLYENGAAGVEKWENAVNDAGYAADTAARMQDNLAGDLEKLGGAFDTVLIQSGSGANEVMRGLVQGLESLVDTVGKIPAPVLGVGTGLAALVGGAALAGGAFVTVVPKIQATREALDLLAPAGSKANAALSKTGKIAAGAATGLAAVAAASAIAQPALENILKPTGETGDALEAFGGQAAQGAVGADTLNKSFQDLVQGREGIGAFQGAIEGIADPGLWGNIDNIVVGGIKILSLGMADVTSTSDKARERMKALGDELASLDAKKAAESFQDMAAATDGSEDKLKQLLDLMPAYRSALEDQAKAAGLATDDQTLLDIAMGKIPATAGAAGDAIKTASEKSGELSAAFADIGVSADGTVADLAKFTEALLAAGLMQLSARDAARNWSQALLDMGLQADGTGGKIGILGTEFDNTTAKGIKNQAMFDGVAQAGIRNAESMATAGASNEELQGSLTNTYNGLVAAAGQFGITGVQAESLARKVLGVPDGVSIESWMSDAAKRMADATGAAADRVNGKRVDIYVNTHETTFQKVIKQFSSEPDKAPVGTNSVLAPGRATGGRLAGFADGGQLPTTGPGTGMTDGFLGISSAGVPLARVDAGEWIINGNSSQRYNRELAAINAGTFPKLPGFATGGMFAAGSFAGSAGGSNVTVSAPAVTVVIGGEKLDQRMYSVAGSVVSAADSQSQFSRRGR